MADVGNSSYGFVMIRGKSHLLILLSEYILHISTQTLLELAVGDSSGGISIEKEFSSR